MGNVRIITMESYLINDDESLKVWTFASDVTKITTFQDELALSEKKNIRLLLTKQIQVLLMLL